MIDTYQYIAVSQSELKIPILYGSDAVHGHNNVYGATIFPHNIGLGAANDPALVHQIAEATGKEVLATGINWVFAPCIAVTRDDRWGRTYESFSENTTLVSILGERCITGLQGSIKPTSSGPNSCNKGFDRLHVIATAKHYVADGGTIWGTGDNDYRIDQGDVSLSEDVIRNMHLYPYKAAIAAGVGSIMVSFSSINKIKMHGNGYWIQDVLRNELGFKGEKFTIVLLGQDMLFKKRVLSSIIFMPSRV